MSVIYTQTYKSPMGELIIGDYNGKLCMLDWQYRRQRAQVDSRVLQYLGADFQEQSTLLHAEVIAQLQAYFSKERTVFDLPLLFAGSDFQQRVWQQLLEIPYGKTVSYLALSKHLGDEKAIRAVASANGANAISIVVPCHRVVGSSGALTGYAGGLPAKQRLLELEGATVQSTLF